MHKYWKRPATLTVIVLLVFMMTLPLTACQIEIPGIGTVNIKDSDLPNNGGNMSGDDGGDDVDGVNTEGGYDDSLDLLRKEMDAPSYMLAAAYIGSAAGGPDDFELPMRDWVNEAAPELCAKYPFSGISRGSGWWAAAAICTAWCPVTQCLSRGEPHPLERENR